MDDLEFHEHAGLFPLMTETEFRGLVQDIKENGQRDTIFTLDGKILDGRNRYRACLEIGIKPVLEPWTGEGSPQAFVISHNLHRRHLNESQRAMIAARIATRTKIEAAAENLHPTATNSRREMTPTNEAAAALLNVGRESVSLAKKVINEATLEEIAEIDAGNASVSSLGRKLRKKIEPKERQILDKQSKRTETVRANAQLWGMFRDALNNLSGLPRAEDMIRVVRGFDKAKITTPKLPSALKWLEEFSHAWNRSGTEEVGKAASGNRKDHPRNGVKAA